MFLFGLLPQIESFIVAELLSIDLHPVCLHQTIDKLNHAGNRLLVA
jgi:hypothetical protein